MDLDSCAFSNFEAMLEAPLPEGTECIVLCPRDYARFRRADLLFLAETRRQALIEGVMGELTIKGREVIVVRLSRAIVEGRVLALPSVKAVKFKETP